MVFDAVRQVRPVLHANPARILQDIHEPIRNVVSSTIRLITRQVSHSKKTTI